MNQNHLLSSHLLKQKTEMTKALSSALTTDESSPPAGNDVFEAFLFSLVLRAARREGYTVSFEAGRGRPPRTFRLRRSPGRLSTGADFNMQLCKSLGHLKMASKSTQVSR